MNDGFAQGVKPGGLTTSTEIRILLCYLLDNIKAPITREQIENVLLQEELANYFVLADSMASLEKQGLVLVSDNAYVLTEAGRTVARTLAQSVPRSVRNTAIRGVILAQQYAVRAATQISTITMGEHGANVSCAITDESGPLFKMELYMPDELSSQKVKDTFLQNGDSVYRLVLAALTKNKGLVKSILSEMDSSTDDPV